MLEKLYKAIANPIRFTLTEGKHSNIFGNIHPCKCIQVESYINPDDLNMFFIRYLLPSHEYESYSMVIGHTDENKNYTQYNINGDEMEGVVTSLEDKFGVMLRV